MLLVQLPVRFLNSTLVSFISVLCSAIYQVTGGCDWMNVTLDASQRLFNSTQRGWVCTLMLLGVGMVACNGLVVVAILTNRKARTAPFNLNLLNLCLADFFMVPCQRHC